MVHIILNHGNIIACSISDITLWKGNRFNRRIQEYLQLSNDNSTDTKQCTNFFRENQKEKKGVQQNITQHNALLWNEWFSDILRSMPESNNNRILWKKYFSTFRYKKEILQHFYTGHKDLYTSLVQIIELEKSNVDTTGIYKKINDLIDALENKRTLGVQPLHGKCEVCIEYYDWIQRLLFKKSVSKFRIPNC